MTLELSGLPQVRRVRLVHYRIDETHSNAYAAWKRMGSPAAPSAEQYAQLEAAGQLAILEPPTEIAVAQGAAILSFILPRQAVSLLVLTWDPP